MRCFFLAKFPLLSQIQTIFNKLLVRQTSNHHHCNWHAQKTYKQGFSSDFEQFFLVKNNFVYFKDKYGFQTRNATEKNTLFLPGRNAQNSLILYTERFFDVQIPTALVLMLYIPMFPSYGLYICIIFAHHRTTFGIFCYITQNTTPEENIQKMFHISSPIVLFFLWEGQGCFWGIRIKFHLGRAKGRARGECGGRSPNEGYFCKIPIIKPDTNLIQQTVGQTNF